MLCDLFYLSGNTLQQIAAVALWSHSRGKATQTDSIRGRTWAMNVRDPSRVEHSVHHVAQMNEVLLYLTMVPDC